MNKTQLQIVKEKIDRDGIITRNWCLQHYITRLSAIIFKLKEQGYKFDEGYTETRDYFYKTQQKTIDDYKRQIDEAKKREYYKKIYESKLNKKN